MKKLLLSVLIIFCSLNLAGKDKSIQIDEKYRSFMERYCVDCHNAKKTKGKVRLDKEGFPFEISNVRQADQWQHILAAMNAKEMPPEDEKQPEAKEKLEFLGMLSEKLVEARAMLSDSGGKTTMRRLNRREYQNTIKSLLGVSVNVSELPDDLSSGTFDTNGGSLFMSPDQIEKYIAIARSAVSSSMNSEILDTPALVRIEPEIKVNEQVKRRHDIYIKNLKAAKAYTKAQKEGSDKKPSDFGIIDKKEVEVAFDHYERFFGSYGHYVKNPYSKTGILPTLVHPIFDSSFLINSSVRTITTKNKNGTERQKKQRMRLPDGWYKIRAKVARFPDSPSERCFLDFGFINKEKFFQHIKTFHITANIDKPEIIEAMIFLGPDNRRISFQEKQNSDAAYRKYHTSRSKIGRGPNQAMWIDWFEFEGPFKAREEPQLKKILNKANDKDLTVEKVSKILSEFAGAVFRDRKVDSKYIQGLTNLYIEELKSGKKAKEAIVEPMAVILSSPSFLYLTEPLNNKKIKTLSQMELATRLSYFLWSSPPDEELKSIARAAKLKGTQLRKQVDRMLADDRSINFIRSFTYQWLGMERLDFFKFDVRLYPDFDNSMKKAAAEEVYQTIKYIIDQKLGTEKLLKSDFLVINGLMAEHYGIKNVEGNEYRKVQLPPNSVRGGLTGMAAILAMGSDGKHTSPVERGAWVLRKILNRPPPPAPANVPQLSRLEGKRLSAKEILKVHQEEPQCSHCHKKIDPIGIGLENFDAIGQWRTEVKVGKGRRAKAEKIDPSGTVYRGPEFKSYQDLRNIFYSKVDDFNKGLISSLLAYSMSREFGFSDQSLIEELQTGMKKNKNSLNWLIHEIVQLETFRTKK